VQEAILNDFKGLTLLKSMKENSFYHINLHFNQILVALAEVSHKQGKLVFVAQNSI